MNGKPLIWFDNAATTQKPKAVIDRLAYFYEHENSNIHRAAHELAARATDAYEDAREAVRRFLNAPSTESIVFARGTTEAINLVAQSWGRQHIGPGDEIIITHLEHHANIVPWQLLCWEKGAKIRVAPVDDLGQVRLDEYQKLFNSRTRIVSFTQVSNALGTVTPAKEMIEIARRARRARAARRRAVRLAHGASTCRSSIRTSSCSRATRCSARPGIGVLFGKPEVLERHAALAGRRQHDRRRHVRADVVPSARRCASRRARATSRMLSGSLRRSSMSSASASTTSTATSTG